MKARLLPFAVAAAMLALPAVAAADPPPPAPCTAILAPRPALELPVQVAPGLTVRVRDPYGGLIARNSLFVAFSVRYARQTDRARVRSVTWLVDGHRPGRDEGGRDQLLAPSRMYAPAIHVISVRIAPAAGGPPVEAQWQVTATDCRLAFVAPSLDRSGKLTVVADSGGPPLRAVALAPAAGRFAVPRHGRLGTLTALPSHQRIPVGAPDLLAASRRLRIGDLPPATTAVRIRLAPGVTPRGRPCALSVSLQGATGAPARLVAGPRC